ncbi:flavin reductase family protein [Rhodococcus jostii]|uniref:NADH-FMN oxidoreductase RutF, flavin reductase (DIM6/NTAB) family n=1 Tax=Rhodococcus jostii TaxID=132919 RepID=A0A1H4ZCH6_RHOJO|nr:flavin reductase family protein [Rhodococcus jostii]SED27080.1 NADH-FMN oxidoreductase RutF, flavin reductase (DIM6/NTAB) family [Rhodococcus jostii]
MITTQPPTVDDATMRGVHRTFVTGVTVVTTMDHGVPKGLAVNAFSSISLDPALVMVCVQRSSATHDPLFRSTHLGINILAADQLSTASVFASKGVDKFAAVPWSPAEHGSPVLSGACAWMEAEICERLQVRTHTAFVARVVGAEHSDRPALVYRAGEFFDSSRLHPA